MKSARGVLSAHEEQNRHLARELHDAVCQRLAAMGMEIDAMQQKPPRSSGELSRWLQQLSGKVASLANTMHEISHQLHPAVLDDLGLPEALNGECLAFSELYGNPVTFTAEKITEKLPPDLALCLYRIAQETLRNAGKHAPGAPVSVSLTGSSGAITLCVEDQGPGFGRLTARQRGLGFISMKERTRMVNGKLSVLSSEGKGTTVKVRVPVKRTAGQAS